MEMERGETSSNHLKQPHLNKYSTYLASLLSPSHGETLDPKSSSIEQHGTKMEGGCEEQFCLRRKKGCCGVFIERLS